MMMIIMTIYLLLTMTTKRGRRIGTGPIIIFIYFHIASHRIASHRITIMLITQRTWQKLIAKYHIIDKFVVEE